MALPLLSLLCNVNEVEHYILLIIHRLRSRVYTLQVNNAKESNLFVYLIAAQQLIGFSIENYTQRIDLDQFIAEFGKSSRRDADCKLLSVS